MKLIKNAAIIGMSLFVVSAFGAYSPTDPIIVKIKNVGQGASAAQRKFIGNDWILTFDPINEETVTCSNGYSCVSPMTIKKDDDFKMTIALKPHIKGMEPDIALHFLTPQYKQKLYPSEQLSICQTSSVIRLAGSISGKVILGKWSNKNIFATLEDFSQYNVYWNVGTECTPIP